MEGVFERSTGIVSKGCETSMKKFNFNFKFLDRFKKSKSSENTESEDQQQEYIFEPVDSAESELTDEETTSIEDATLLFQEMPRPNADSTTTRTVLVSDADKSFLKNDSEESTQKTELDFNLDKFREDNKHLVNDNLEESTEPEMTFEEMEASASPVNRLKEKPKFKLKLKFPKFKNATDFKFKEKFSNNSPLKSLDKFSWNDFVIKLFSPYTRRRIHSVFIILLVVTFTYLTGKGIALFLNRSTPVVSTVKSNINLPIEKADTTLQDINKITSTNLFNIKESDKTTVVTESKDISSIICLDAEKPTSEPLKLLDTIVLQDSVKSVAAVSVRGSSDLVNVREGEHLNDTVEVSKIKRMKIILKNLTTGDCEYISGEEEEMAEMPNVQIMSKKQAKSFFKSSNPMIKNTGNSFKIKRQFRDKMMSNMSEILTQARAVQINNPDGSLSFKMTEIVPGSIYSQLNIQNDDVITSVNGKKIENLTELMNHLTRFKEADQFQIGLKRNGINENLEYGFE